MWLRATHWHSRGLLHGGVIAALADNTMGLSCGSSLAPARGLITLGLTAG
jgi:acyl-coenzyme A thioesterase PaaI-like protein